MASGAVAASEAQWAVAITGIAGPSGGSADKPVGTVCFAWAGPGAATAVRLHLPGDRAAIRHESVAVAIRGLIDRLS
jgi:nicotinamide-nucleotide amidase